jgi:hypothetical protein
MALPSAQILKEIHRLTMAVESSILFFRIVLRSENNGFYCPNMK